MKTLKICDESHKKIKEYCEQNGLKLIYWVEKTLLEKINNKEKKNGTKYDMEKKMSKM